MLGLPGRLEVSVMGSQLFEARMDTAHVCRYFGEKRRRVRAPTLSLKASMKL